MQIQVRLFATLRQLAGWPKQVIDLPDGSTVADALAELDRQYPQLAVGKRTIYVALNQEYARGAQVLHEGDEVAIFPPVSGGAEGTMPTDTMPTDTMPTDTMPTDAMTIGPVSTGKKLYEITEEPLSLDDAARRVTRPDCGAIATFAGTVRGETATDEGPRGTDFLIYEAYTEMAERTLAQIGDEIKQKWPKVEAVSILHRTGRLEIGEPSVVIAVATPHRGDGCFEACRYAIERLKAVVPIWKQENWSDGSMWIEGPRGDGVTR